MKEGKFRGDLFARLNEHVVRLPPLRERKEDIFLLAHSFCARYGRPSSAFTFSFLVALFHYDWPFNVRELESCIKRGVALTDGARARHAAAARRDQRAHEGLRRARRASRCRAAPAAPSSASMPHRTAARRRAAQARPPTEDELRALLERHRGNVAAVGRELGKERMQVHRWLKKYDIDLDALPRRVSDIACARGSRTPFSSA